MKVEAERGLITNKIKGKVVDYIATQGDYLLISCMDGQEYRIGWRDEKTNELVPGSPSLEGIDMRIIIDPLAIFGTAEF